MQTFAPSFVVRDIKRLSGNFRVIIYLRTVGAGCLKRNNAVTFLIQNVTFPPRFEDFLNRA